MSGDELRNRIAEVAWASRPRPGGAVYQHGGTSTADAILALPEMQAMLAKDDDIERLTAELAAKDDKIKRLRAAGDALADALERRLNRHQHDAITAWDDARYG